MNRDANVDAFVREFISSEFAGRVLERFAAYAGDSYGHRTRGGGSLRAFERKLSDEIIDVAGYCAIIAARTDDARARALLAAIAERAGEADRLVAELQRLSLPTSERVA